MNNDMILAADGTEESGATGGPDISAWLDAVSQVVEKLQGAETIGAQITESANAAVASIIEATTTGVTAVTTQAGTEKAAVKGKVDAALGDIEKAKAAAIQAIANATPTVFEAAEETDNFPV